MPKSKFFAYLKFAGILSVTLGLAPFVPEPHIIGKIRWVWGGAVGMQPIDWFDFFLHGIPWLLFLALLVYGFITNRFTLKSQ
jgi:hypothetical protein